MQEQDTVGAAPKNGGMHGLNFHKDNNFYIFGGIDNSMPEKIIAPFIELIDRKSNLKNPGQVHIYVSSYGGLVQYGFDFIQQMERAKDAGITVNTYVSSVACSCGSLIAVAGTPGKRYIGERAYHLLHFMRGSDYAHNPIMMERNFENGKFWHKVLLDIYKKYTKIQKLEEKLLADNYMVNGAAACIKAGLADLKM
jgi:ATP-dependent protease ClpP protease subunit